MAAAMDSFTWLLLLCAAMFIGAYGSGYIPLAFSLSEKRLRLITIFGAGLLVGTALIVIIPEGIAMHYSGQNRRAAALAAGKLGGAGGGTVAAGAPRDHGGHAHAHAHAHGRRLLEEGAAVLAVLPPPIAGDGATAAAGAGAMGAGLAASPMTLTSAAAAAFVASEAGGGGGSGAAGGGDGANVDGGAAGATAPEEEFSHAHPGHYQIGAALAIGFAFQLLVDRLSGGLHSHTASAVVTASAAGKLAASSSAALAGDDAPARLELNVRANTGGDHSAKSKSAMAGMVVHAFVDGVALGAAVREGDSALGLLVFIAIMLHKAPSAFGLSSYLLHHGISHDGVKRRLALFSSAAPVGALATYSLLSANLFTYKQEMLALCLLFSGGTFLYVATAHVLPEIQAGNEGDGGHCDEEEGGGSHTHGHSHAHGPRMNWLEVWVLVAGVLFPLLLDVHHGH